MKKHFILSIGLLALVMLCSNTNAQMFANQEEDNDNKTSSQPNTSPQQASPWLSNPRRVPVRQQPAKNEKQTKIDKKSGRATAEDTNKKEQPKILDIPQTERPTLDGVKRGHVSMRPVVTEENQDKEDRYIYLYYSNYSVKTTFSGSVRCNLRFIVLSTLDRKINNISFRLKWPKMDIPVSFSEVTPNIETFFDYALIGDGCYSIDKTPNIVVNRCRIREMSEKECASKIKWLKKAR